MNEKIPAGFKLRHVLTGHKGVITRIAWSDDGRFLASPSRDGTVIIWNPANGNHLQTLAEPNRGHPIWYSSVAWSPDGTMVAVSANDRAVWLWHVESGEMYWTLDGHLGPVHSVSWARDGKQIATASSDRTVRIWDVENIETLFTLKEHYNRVYTVAWSPDGQTLVSGGADSLIRIWDSRAGILRQTLEGHMEAVTAVTWSSDGQWLASASLDNTVRIWDAESGRPIRILEGHADSVVSASFSAHNELLSSKSRDGTVRLWRCDNWQLVTVLEEQAFADDFSRAAFHPHNMVLASLGEVDSVVRIWELDLPYLLEGAPPADTVHYTNARVLLMGDTGVGKTGLGLVLTGNPFQPTESTHGRHVWTLSNEKITFEDGREETRETLLWDLAGQPGYRLIHQLYLNEIAVALVLFDSRSEIDPFAGVRHWSRALRQAERIQGESAIPVTKFLVAARVDRGGIGVSEQRLEATMRELGFHAYFETSAKEGWDIDTLRQAIQDGIVWDALPKVSSNELFQLIKNFLVSEKEKGRVLTTFDDLYNIFKEQHGHQVRFAQISDDQDMETMLRTQFETCIGLVESRDLIRRLSFGSLILLQPELLDAYASAIVNAAKGEPDGLGSVFEEEVKSGRFRMSQEERIRDQPQEALLLIATIEDLLRYEIALREPTDGGPILVFPSEFTRERGEAPDPEGKAIVFTFEGAILNIYATLAVRLLRSVVFVKDEMWHNVVTFRDKLGGSCGMMLTELEEGKGKLTLFFGKKTGQQTRRQFEEYVRIHLQRRALPDTIFRHPIFNCGSCGFTVTEQLVRLRVDRGFDWVYCPVCTNRILIVEEPEKIESQVMPVVSEMDKAADEMRALALNDSIFQGKIATGDFDVFVCYHPSDENAIQAIVAQLKERGILPWPHDWDNLPQQAPVMQVKAIAFFVGKRGTGPGNPHRLATFLSQLKLTRCPVIPSLMPGGPPAPPPPRQFTELPWVDFRHKVPDPIEQLVNTVTEGRGRTSHRQPSAWVVGVTSLKETPRLINLDQLKQVMQRAFDEKQLRQMCIDLRVRHRELRGNTAVIANELVDNCNRRGQIHELILRCRQQYAEFPW